MEKGREGGSKFFFFKQKTAYEVLSGLVGSEVCIRDRRMKFGRFPQRAFCPGCPRRGLAISGGLGLSLRHI